MVQKISIALGGTNAGTITDAKENLDLGANSTANFSNVIASSNLVSANTQTTSMIVGNPTGGFIGPNILNAEDIRLNNNVVIYSGKLNSVTNVEIAANTIISANIEDTTIADIKLANTYAQPALKQSWTAQQRPLTSSLTSNTTLLWDCDVAQDATVNLASTITTVQAPDNQVAGSYYSLRITVGTGPYSITSWASSYKFPGGTAPTLTTTALANDIITFRSDGSNMEVTGISQDVK